MNKHVIEKINAATTHVELNDVVEAYLLGLGLGLAETEAVRGETYAETAELLGGDEVLAAAERRWWELEQ